MTTIIFEKGNVVNFDSLPGNSIALDGYVQGPAIDPATRRFSFDHHAGCLRLVTKATCEQVREAICLGLPIDADTKVFVNDIDADTVLSCWLILNPGMVWDEKVKEIVDRVGKTDSHGPIFPSHPLHRKITPPWGKDAAPQSHDMLMEYISKVDAWVNGTDQVSETRREEKSSGWGWSARTGWRPVSTETGFDGFYKQGFVLGFLSQEAPNETRMYTVAKASDLVAAPLGPGSKKRPASSVDDFEDTILGALARAEQAKNPEQSLAHTWGGGSSIGGSPRNPDGSSSRLEPEEVLKVFKRFAG